MINDTISHIEESIRKSSDLTGKQKEDLLLQIGELRKEISALSKTHPEQAQSIAGFTQVSMHEAIRGEKDPELARLSFKGLEESVRRFEVSHPQLVGVIDGIMQMLSSMGI
jgi:Mg2+ and Co2+ transporter CorA